LHNRKKNINKAPVATFYIVICWLWIASSICQYETCRVPLYATARSAIQY